jgi:hypothetical protein
MGRPKPPIRLRHEARAYVVKFAKLTMPVIAGNVDQTAGVAQLGEVMTASDVRSLAAALPRHAVAVAGKGGG